MSYKSEALNRSHPDPVYESGIESKPLPSDGWVSNQITPSHRLISCSPYYHNHFTELDERLSQALFMFHRQQLGRAVYILS